MKLTLITKAKNLTGAAAAALALLLLVAIAKAEPTITWVGYNYPSDVSADGSVVVGNTNDGTYQPWRWTAADGLVLLDMCTQCVLGSGAGAPKVSDDGSRVSATILTPDSLFVTQGIWVKGEGWHHSMPPVPPTGGSIGESLGSCWGLSGDGNVLTGFFWRPGQSDGTAHANTWSLDGEFVELAPVIRNSRGNALNRDGSVVVGWSERFDGVWQPTLWENGGYTLLHQGEWFTEATAVTNDGTVVVGNAFDPLTNQVAAAMWLRNGNGWDQQILGVLPGTFPGSGQAMARSVSSAGDIVVGFNQFDRYNATGFVWTIEQGMMSAADYLASLGLSLPAGYVVSGLSAVSHDGRVITGSAYNSSVFPSYDEGFIVKRDAVSAVPAASGDVGLAIESNHPNPFNPSTTIALSLDREQVVRVEVFDLRGRSVRVLHDGRLAGGRHELVWDGRDADGGPAASGMYLARARGEAGEARPHRMMLVK